jgi:hypothetical protein
MRRPWIWTLILGVILGAGLGFVLSHWLLLESPAKGSAFLTNFSLQEAAGKAGDAIWNTTNDGRVYLGHSSFTRQITARATMPPQEQGPFIDRSALSQKT